MVPSNPLQYGLIFLKRNKSERERERERGRDMRLVTSVAVNSSFFYFQGHKPQF
jgi:hypothetical protein